jgi:hypothetical protein
MNAQHRHLIMFRPGRGKHAAVAVRDDPELVAAATTAYALHQDVRHCLGVDGPLLEEVRSVVDTHIMIKQLEGGTLTYEQRLVPLARNGLPPVHTSSTTSRLPTAVSSARSDVNGDASHRSGTHAQDASARTDVDTALAKDLFDGVRDTTFEGLRLRHWHGFSMSDYFIRFLQFKFLESKPVTQADFSLFR